MTTAKHTPGPWVFDGEYIWAATIGGYVLNPQTEDMLNGECIARRAASDQIKANGRLGAAAPELLSALQECRDMILCECADGSYTPQVAAANAAIAKATGAV